LHEKYLGVVKKDFSGHSLFQKALKDAFVEIVNKDIGAHTNAELMSTYCDRVLKSGGEKLSDSEVEESLGHESFSSSRTSPIRISLPTFTEIAWQNVYSTSDLPGDEMLRRSWTGRVKDAVWNTFCLQDGGHACGFGCWY
jgi:hypothetical protein